MRALLLILLLSLPSLAQGNAKYVPANDAHPLIRRDLIPLDVMSIRELAADLAILADGPPASSPDLLRNRVQALTLSLRLAPVQPRAREILQTLEKSQKRASLEEKEVQKAQQKTAATATWLISRPTESEGHHLAQLLLDILHPLAKEQKILAQHDPQKSHERWKNVVANLSAFKLPEKPAPIEPETTQPVPTPPEPITPDKPSYAVSALLTSVPMFAKGIDQNSASGPGLIKTSLVITKGGNQTTMELKPKPSFSTDPIKSLITKYFKSIKKPLPDGYTLNINTNERRYSSFNKNNLAAPVAMMVDAALSGRPLRRNTYLFADFKADGALGKPARAWDLILDLEELGAPRGSRIIVGYGLLEEMTALLVLKKNNLGTFLSLSAVETRLVKARDFYPAHLSARMLATQAIRRPDTFSRFMLAQELDRRLRKVATFKYEANNTPPSSIKETYKKGRELIDPLGKLIARADRHLLEQADDLVKTLNYIGRGASDTSWEKEAERVVAITKFQTDLLAFRTKLKAIYQSPSKK